LQSREEVVRRLESQLRAGAISTVDVNVARLALIRSRADLADAQRVSAESRARLAAAIGVPARALEDIDIDFEFGSRATEPMTTSHARDLALRGRADILSALADYAASQSALQLEVAKQYPDIHLSPGYSWNAGSTGENDWQLGATVELPLLNQHKGAIAEASARREASAARFLALQAKVIGDIDTATASFRASQTNTAALEALVSTQTTQQRSIEEQFKAGALDRLDVLNGELELSAAALARLDAQVKLEQAVGALEDAVQRPFEMPNAIFQTSRANER
jgi:cobalt-zinc-cadmium efflux system outer membrane protein